MSLIPTHQLVVICLCIVPCGVFAQTGTDSLVATGVEPDSRLEIESNATTADTPALLELMSYAEEHYRQGAELIAEGEFARARSEFDVAINALLEGEWDVLSTPRLKGFFEDILVRIQQDEARYLQPEESIEDVQSALLDELEGIDLIPISIDPELKDGFEVDLANTSYGIPVTLNQTVLSSLDYWLNKGRKYFTDGLRRSGRYRGLIERVFREQSLPLDLMYLAHVESLFKTSAYSRRMPRGFGSLPRGPESAMGSE